MTETTEHEVANPHERCWHCGRPCRADEWWCNDFCRSIYWKNRDNGFPAPTEPPHRRESALDRRSDVDEVPEHVLEMLPSAKCGAPNCDNPLNGGVGAREQHYCSGACKQRAYRRRIALSRARPND